MNQLKFKKIYYIISKQQKNATKTTCVALFHILIFTPNSIFCILLSHILLSRDPYLSVNVRFTLRLALENLNFGFMSRDIKEHNG